MAEPEIAHRASEQPVGTATAQRGVQAAHCHGRDTLPVPAPRAERRAGAALSLQRDARLAPASAPVRIWLGLPGRGRIDRYNGLVEQDGQLWSSNCGVFAAK